VADSKSDTLLRIGVGLAVGPIVKKYLGAWMESQGMPLKALNDISVIFWSIVIYWIIGLLL
jgi:hypothetical protein